MLLMAGLWLLVVMSALAVLGAELGARRRRVSGAVMLGAAALCVCGAWWWSLPESAAGLLWGWQAAAAAVLGAVQAARCYVGFANTIGYAAALALLIAMAAFPLAALPEQRVAPFLGAALLLLVAVLALRLHGRGAVRALRVLRYSGALTLLWAGAFLVYLQVAPQSMPAAAPSATPANVDTAEARPVSDNAWEIIALSVLGGAMLFGFLRKQRLAYKTEGES